MSRVITELRLPGGKWVSLGPSFGPGDAPGSLVSHEPTGRQVYLFGFLAGEAGVWRSQRGGDVEEGMIRVVIHLGALERLTDFTSGPYEMTQVRASGLLADIRFRVE